MCKCGCDNNDQELARLSDIVNTMSIALAPFINGHPLLALQELNDIADFDPTTGLGSDIWSGWAIANGQTYTINGSTVTTYDMRDRVPVGSGTSYTVGQMIGEATHTLTIPELPIISLAINDPGHIHAITDAGHIHGITDPGHTHSATQSGHTHSFTTSTDGDHTHALVSGAAIVSGNNAGLFLKNDGGASEVSDSDSLALSGAHDHTGVTDSVAPSITVSTSFTGISVNSATTGIVISTATTGITIDPFGSGNAHNNLQPSCGVLWVQKIA